MWLCEDSRLVVLSRARLSGECAQGPACVMSNSYEKSDLIGCTFLKNMFRVYVLIEVRYSHACIGVLHYMLNSVPRDHFHIIVVL